jgi:hypothetical protein
MYGALHLAFTRTGDKVHVARTANSTTTVCSVARQGTGPAIRDRSVSITCKRCRKTHLFNSL